MTTQKEQHKPEHSLNIFINQKKFDVTATSMTPRQLLELADEQPAQTKLSLREQGQLHAYDNLDESIPLRNGMHFIATYIGSTPVS
ncbi:MULTISPECIES: hypothetical protein [Deinococcus]|uniref:hypothetical protein n=1 Tax=Deinococcus TaxID=1298 RepID=UPI00166448FD|nr:MULTISPECIES: hypothetical protein [Deinococcus]MDK2014577.1 hypothetical protein [Deinococcus sp. 43]GGB79802.1 hypothetical protein GCM10008019_40070 [Deinococcus soli (ex Cha et al. 2016)]